MALDGAFGEEQTVRHLGIGQPFGDQLKHLALAQRRGLDQPIRDRISLRNGQLPCARTAESVAEHPLDVNAIDGAVDARPQRLTDQRARCRVLGRQHDRAAGPQACNVSTVPPRAISSDPPTRIASVEPIRAESSIAVRSSPEATTSNSSSPARPPDGDD